MEQIGQVILIVLLFLLLPRLLWKKKREYLEEEGAEVAKDKKETR